MTFEEWMKRPVYVAQCHTWAIAAKLELCGHHFRSLPGYRNDEARQARRLVAEVVRLERARRRGTAVRTDLGEVTFHWAFTGPSGVFGGTLAAQDVRDALLTALLADADGGRLFAEVHQVPPDVVGSLPGNRQEVFSLAGDWGRLTSVLASTQA